MLDRRLRVAKYHLLAPITRRAAGRAPALALTALGLTLALGAGASAWGGLTVVAVVCWLFSRLADGLDGEVARARGRASDFGGYTDLLVDSIGYAAVPIGIAAGAGDMTTWAVVTVLIATFYVNSVSWLMLSALLEKRSLGVTSTGETTSIVMPTGLIEGAETIVLFTIALAIPDAAAAVFAVMAAAVAVTVAQRVIAARGLLSR